MNRPYRPAATRAHEIKLKFIKERMQDLDITNYRLSKLTGISEQHIGRILSGSSMPSTIVMDELYGALRIRPYFKMAEDDDTEMNREFFN